MPRGILEVTWEHICEGGFLSLLEGFSRVPYCSTEGRSLMSMDLAAFADGIDAASIIHRLDSDKLVSAPPLVAPKRGMRYIDMYIKVFYYPEEVSTFPLQQFYEFVEGSTSLALTLAFSTLGCDGMDFLELRGLSVESHVGIAYLWFER